MQRIANCLFILLIVCLAETDGACQQKCIDADGEAVIVNNDAPSAKMEAVARAKWFAIEQAVGLDVKVGSLVQNFTLVDDVVKTQAGGVVKSYKVLSEQNTGHAMLVKINACVEPSTARQAVSSLSLNNSVALFIPARKPGRSGDEYEETNILSETLIGKLTDQSYKVIDVAPSQVKDAEEIERAVRGGSTLAVRTMMYKYLSNVIIIGKVDYTISAKQGQDIGYGLSLPFNNVTVRLTYRMVAKSSKSDAVEILTAGTEEGKGMAGSVEDAAAGGMKDLAEKLTPKILDRVAKYIQGNIKKVRIKVNGVSDLDTNMEIKNTLQNIVWVAGVDENGMGEYTVGYPENSIYLANSIKQKGRFTVDHFTPYSITLTYQK